MSGHDKLNKLNKLLNKYYGAENDDDFNQTEYEIINGYVDWLINVAEKFYPENDLNLDEQLAESDAYIKRQKEYIKQINIDKETLIQKVKIKINQAEKGVSDGENDSYWNGQLSAYEYLLNEIKDKQ